MKIQSVKQGDNTVVWYLNETNCAEVVTVSKGYFGWSTEFKGRKVDGFGTRATATADAKKQLKKFASRGGK